MTTTKLRPLAVLAATALIGAGCGSEPAENGGTGTTAAASSGSTAAGGSKATAQSKAVKFAECVRRNGVADFPDPDAKGEFQYGVSVTPTVWTKAVTACKSLQPPGSLSSKRTPKEQKASLKFAQCVRAHGVKDFPDPVDGEPLINTYKIPSSNRPGGMDILNAATTACRKAMADALAGR